jgi:Secretion system C-terminal sorting domain/Putative metal-binding motif/HYR domain
MRSLTKYLLLAACSLAAFSVFAQISNDDCSTAFPIGIGTDPACDNNLVLNGTTDGATPSWQGTCRPDLQDTWYSFVASATAHTVEISNAIRTFDGYAAYVGIEFFSGNCGDLVSSFCAPVAYYQDKYQFGDLVVGNTYFVRVINYDYWAVNFNLCISTPPPPPANDACAGAVVLLPDPLCATPLLTNTQNATLSPVPPCAGCNIGYDDIWFAYTATEVQQFIQLTGISLIDYPDAYQNADVSVYTGSCENLVFTGYNNRNYASGTLIARNQVIGDTYYVRVSSVDAYVVGMLSFKICIAPLPLPANDACAGALPLVPNPTVYCTTAFSGLLKGANPTPGSCYNDNYDDVWYQFVATSSAQRITLGDYFGYEVFSGDCDNMTSVACVTPYQPNKVVSGLTIGTTYYLRIYSNGNAYYDYSGCITTLPAHPDNANCAQAVSIVPAPSFSCASPVLGTTAGVLTDGYSQCQGYYGQVYGPGIWYKFEATAHNYLVLIDKISLLYGTNENFTATLMEGSDCSSLQYKQCLYIGSENYLEQLTIGQTYYLFCNSAQYTADSFQICIGTVLPPPNDECATATTLQPLSGPDCTAYHQDIYYGATSSGTDCEGNAVNDIWYQFTATSTAHAVIMQYSYQNPNGFEWYKGSDCTGLVSLGCSNQLGGLRQIQTGLTVGETYFIRVFNSSNQFFNIKICITTLPPPPVNDECDAAIEVVPVFDTYCDAPFQQGTTLGASSSQTSCDGAPSRDVWYTFTATSISYLFQLHPTVKDYYDNGSSLSFQLFGGDCNNLTSILCKEHIDQVPTTIHNLVPGQTYFIRVFSSYNTAHDFNLCLVALPIPPNDDCAQATTVATNTGLSCDVVTHGTTKGAGFGPNANTPDTWYTFTATSNTHIISIKNIQTNSSVSGLRFDLYRGNDCNNLSNPSQFMGEYGAFLDTLTIGTTYILRTYPLYDFEYFNFDICIQTAPPSPPNEDCIGAFDLTPNAGLDCTIVTAGTTLGAINDTQTSYCHGGHDVWYKFTATAFAHKIEASNMVQVLGDYYLTGIELLESTDCTNFTVLACQENLAIPIEFYQFVPGKTYYVKTVSYAGWATNYDLCVKTIPPPPNDLCANAQPLDIATDQYCQNLVVGTTLGAGKSMLTNVCYGDKNDVWYSFKAKQSAHTITVHTQNDAIWGQQNSCDLAVFRGNCTNSQLVTCLSDFYGEGTMLLGELVVGTTYFIRISSVETGIVFGICVGTPPAPPSNDACIKPRKIPVSEDENCFIKVFGALENATPTPTGTYSPNLNYTYRDVWFSFKATQANHNVEATNILNLDETNYNYYNFVNIEVYSGTCGALVLIGQPAQNYGSKMTFTNLVVGDTYFIKVFQVYNHRMTFDLCVTSPQPPSNDECAGATPLLIDPNLVCQSATTASTFAATQSVPGCSDKPINDIWLQFTASSSTSRLNVQMQGGDHDYTFGMEILEGDCASLTPYLDCAEYAYGKIINLQNLVEGHTYFIRLYTFVNQTADFSVCLTYLPLPPANDNCDQTEFILANNGIDCVQKYFGTTLGATPSLLNCYGEPAQDVWYQFVATSTKHFIDLKSTGYPFGYGYGSLGFQMYEGGDCTNLLPFGCYDNADGQPTIVENLTIGNTYTLRVFTNEIDAREFSLCIRALPELPDNSNCAAALEIVPSPNLECSNPIAGTTAALTDINNYGCYYGTSLWYKFTATSDKYLIRLQDTVQQYGAGFVGFELLWGYCSYFYNAACPNNLEIYALYLVPGNEYYIRVVGEQYSGVGFNLCVMTIVPPANDLCANATTVVPNVGLDCVHTYPGTTLNVTTTDDQNRDIWYDFTATSTSHTFEILNIEMISGYYSRSLNYDLYKGDNCDGLTLVAQFNSNYAAVSRQLVLGAHYFVRIYSSYNDFEANFDFCIKTLPTSPPNEYCAGAYELIPNTGLDCTIVTSGTTEGAVEGQSCIVNTGADVWYKFTATATAHVVNMFNVSSPSGGEYLSFEVLQSTDCASFISLGCNTYFNQGLYASGLTVGAVYYIRVANLIGSVFQYEICITTLPAPPNDRCENAEPMNISAWQSCEYYAYGTTYGATPTSGLTACGETGNDVWYSFIATQSAHTFTSYSNIGYLNIELLTGECGNLQHLECRNGVYNSSTFTFGELIPGATYLLRVNTIGAGAEFNICISTPPLPPANDACIDAIVLPVSPDETCVTLVSGTTEWATPSFNVPNSGFGNVSNDIWYTFTATGTNHLITVSNYYSYNSYLQLDVYSGNCAALTLIGGQSLWSNNRLLLTNLTPGASYTLRLYDAYYSANMSTFDICVTSVTPPANDECTGALPLVVNPSLNCLVQTNATGYGATPSMPDCNEMPSNDIWYQFTATSTSHALSTNAYHLGIEVFEGNCGALIPVVTCTILDSPKEIIQNLVIGNTYYVRFFFSGNIAPFEICLQALPAAPANDECAQAIVIQPNSGLDCTFSYEGSTLGATQSAPACNGSGTHDIWYQFVATNTTHLLNLKAKNPLNNGANAGYNVELYSGSDCDNLTSLFCTNPYNVLIWNDLVVGNTYFVRIFSIQNTAVDITFCILTPPPPPANADCSGAIELIPSQDLNCSQPVSGTTGGLSWDETTGNWISGTSLWYQFTATSNAHVVELQHIVELYGYNYTQLYLYEGTCDGLQLLSYGNKIINSNLVPGHVYYVKVYGRPNAAYNFDICILTVPPPTNITCLEAQPLQVWPANCEAATSSVLMGGDPYYSYYYNGCNTINSAWFKFEATYSTHFITVNQRALENIFSGLKYELFVGDCDQLTSIGCYPKPYAPHYQYFNPGTTYYVRVGSEQSQSALFDICISTPQPDLDFVQFQLPDNCKPGDNETLKLWISNSGGKTIDIGTASITLSINGANTGNYGPFFNTTMIYPGSYEIIDLSGLDLSNIGVNQMVANATLQYDSDLTYNTIKLSFTGQNPINYYVDGDGDGYGNAAQSFVSCAPIEGFVPDNTDCDDTDFDIHPGATETCNGIDDDCNGLVDADDPNVQNTQTLVLTCPDNIIMENNTGTCSTLVYYDLMVSDNCANTLTQDSGLPTGSLFPVGTTLNSFILTDPDGNQVTCNFTVQVQKAADPDLQYAYTVIGLNDVLMRGNTVFSGGVGVVNANKKARLQLGTTVIGANSFVKSPILELQGGSQVTKYYNGQVPSALLPVFQANTTPSSNNISIPANSNAVTLGLASYGNIIVGAGTTVIFSGQPTVFIKELTIKAGAIILFDQSTTLLVNKGIAIAANADFNPGGSQLVQCFSAENVTIERGCDIFAHIYTQKDLLLEKASDFAPTNMTGSFIAFNVYAPEFVQWNWDENYCPIDPIRPASPESERTTENAITQQSINGMRIAPNPASSQAQVSFELENDTPIKVQVMDATGRLVQTAQINGVKGNNQVMLQLSKLSEGLYTVQVRGQGYQSIGKLVISYP